MFHAARELSRRGWHCMPTVRNAQGADLYIANADESVVLAIQSKGLSQAVKISRNGKPNGMTVPLGTNLDKLRSPWWIITTGCKDGEFASFILTLEEVRSGAFKTNPERSIGGKSSYWLKPEFYARAMYREAWGRLGDPVCTN